MINGKYHTERTWKGKRIIIDLAVLNRPEILRNQGDHKSILKGGLFEAMTMYQNGREIECHRSHDFDEAVSFYEAMLDNYPEDGEKPLTGKYAKLRDDLIDALEEGTEAERSDPEDGGTCNFDASAIYLPRWNFEKVKQAVKEAGTSARKWDLYGKVHIVINPITRGQGNARSRNAEAVTRALKAAGYDSMDYSAMD